jgi:hypothetical protein
MVDDALTCSVVIYSRRDVAIRLCRRPAARCIEIEGEVLFAVCGLHRTRVRKALGLEAA